MLQLTLEPDKRYFLEQKLQMEFMKARNKFVLLTEEDGNKKLEKCNLSVFEGKR